MSTDAITTSLLRQLSAHRATLQTLLAQRAGLGILHAPPGVHAGIAEARAAIAQLKIDLQVRGVAVEDEPGDLAGPEDAMPAAGESALAQRVHYQHISGGTIGVAIAGDLHGDIHLPPAPAPDPLIVAQALLDSLPLDVVPDVAALPTPHRMPLPSNPRFVGRTDDLLALARALKPGGVAAITTGIGGVGKTQLASEFAHRYGQYFAGGVFWLSFADPAGVDTEIAACGGAGALGLYADADKLKLAEQVAKVYAAWEQPIPRLLIFDNCDDSEGGAAEELLAARLPRSGGRRVLITSRRSQWRDPRVAAHALGTLSRAESVALLRGHRADLSESDAKAIAELLGDLPLALSLAGSYLETYAEETIGKPATYLKNVEQALLEHRSLQGAGAAPSLTGHEQHVKATFEVSLKQLRPGNHVDALALAALARAAYLAPGEAFPRELLLATLGEATEDEDAIAQRADALGRLLGLGLFEQAGPGLLRMHRLICAFARTDVQAEDAQAEIERILTGTAGTINDQGFPAAMQPLLPHLLYATAAAIERQDEQAAELCSQLSSYLSMAGNFAEALVYTQHAFTIREHLFGLEHTTTISTLGDLAVLSFWRGDFAIARAQFDRVVTLYERIYPPEHSDVVTNRNNLALTLTELGEYARARAIFEDVLAIRERTLGEQNRLTASSLNNLAIVLDDLGAKAEAQRHYERALAIRRQILPPEHPDITRSMNNLAEILRAQGLFEQAQEYYEQALEIRERVLGPLHPDTALSLNNYASLLRVRGMLTEAQAICERALAIREQVLGPGHPYTAVSLNNLALIRQGQQAYQEALALFERAYHIREAQLGPQHRDTAQTRQNQGELYRILGQQDAARAAFEEALQIYTTTLGADHPLTQACKQQLDALNE